MDVWELSLPQRWFEVQTNDDHWKPPKDHRRDTANKAMEKMGQKDLSLQGMFDVLSIPPVLNEKTTYTTLISAAGNIYQTYAR